MLELQILDIGDDDVEFKYSITLYCKNKNDENIICHIKDFNPSFFIRVPIDSNLSDLKILLKKALEDLLKKDIRKIKEYRDLDEDDLEFIIKLENKLQFYTDENCPYY